MEEQTTPVRRPVRRRKTKMELFKEATLPYLILLAAAVLIVIFIIGALVRGNQTPDPSETAQAAIAALALI